MLRNIVLPGLARDLFDQLACDHVEDIVIGIAIAEAGRWLDMGKTAHRFLAGQIGPGHEQQVASAQSQTAAVDQQVADRHFAGHIGIVHPEPRKMVDHLVIPVNHALIHQQGQSCYRHRLAG